MAEEEVGGVGSVVEAEEAGTLPVEEETEEEVSCGCCCCCSCSFVDGNCCCCCSSVWVDGVCGVGDGLLLLLLVVVGADGGTLLMKYPVRGSSWESLEAEEEGSLNPP